MLDGYIKPTFTGRGNVYCAHAVVTAPVIWSTAAATGGPLLYNGSNVGGIKGVTAYLLAVSAVESVSSTVNGALGLTGGATSAPTSTTVIDSVMNLRFSTGAPASPQCSVYRIGTVSAAGVGFMPIFDVGIGAQSVDTVVESFVHLGGTVEVGVGNFAAIAASATLTTGVFTIGLIWVEIPND